MNIVRAINNAGEFVDAAGNLVRHGQYNPNWVDNPEEYINAYGALGAGFGVGAQGVSNIVQHAISQGGGPAANTRSKQTKLSFRGAKRKRSESNLPGEARMSRRIESKEAAEAAGDPMVVEPSAAVMNAAAAAAKGRQTMITPIPRHVKHGMPEFFTSKLVWTGNVTNASGTLRVGASGLGTTDSDIKIRLNTIYDILPDMAGTQSPSWRTHFATMYDYYTVLSTEVQLDCYISPANSYGIPTVWSVNQFGSDEPTFTVNYHELAKDLNTQQSITSPVVNSATTPAGAPMFDYWQHFSHRKTYHHGDYENKITEIKQDSNDQIWTSVGSDPALAHTLRIMPRLIYAGTQASGPVDRPYVCHAKIIVTAQFKEAKVAYKFYGQS